MVPDENLKQRIKANATTCSQCGHTVSPSASKCENCGSKLATPNQWVPRLLILAIFIGLIVYWS